MKRYLLYILAASLIFIAGSLTAQNYDIETAMKRLSAEEDVDISVRYENKINTDLWEFSPTFYGDGVVFVGSRKSKDILDYDNKTPFFTLRFAEKSKTGNLTLPKAFGARNSATLHEGPVDFNATLDTMYYTLSVPAEEGKTKIPLQIYMAKRGEETWENIGPVDFMDPEMTYAHPTLNAAGNKMIFAAKLGEGRGGMDLYSSERIDGVWTSPVNLGSKINTAGNEVFPRYHPSGILFFSSDGLARGKNLEIYASVEVDGRFIKPVKLRVPFNSDGDNFGIIFDKTGTSGYFTSNRKGTKGKDDILSFSASTEMIPYSEDILPLRIIAQDEVSSKRMSDVTIHLAELDDNGLLTNRDFYDTEFESRGDELQIKLTLKNPALFPQTGKLTDVNGIATIELPTGNPTMIIASKKGYRTQQLKVEDFDLDEIRVKMKFIDCVDFQVLAQDESQSLIDAEVHIVNECDGTSTKATRVGRGQFSACLQPDCTYMITTTQADYLTDTSFIDVPSEPEEKMSRNIVLFQKGSIVKPKKVKEPEKKEKSIENLDDVEAGDLITLRKIYYDFNKSSIRTGAAIELDALVVLMKKYPDMRVELNSHTDSRGSALYNLKLSLERAQSAKLYLVNKGISPSRIQAVGYGESIPLNHCTDGIECTEEEHQYNRRTEVRVLSADKLEIEQADNMPDVIDRKN